MGGGGRGLFYQCVVCFANFTAFSSVFIYFIFTCFNTSLLQTYIHGALENMRHWYSQHFMNHKHGRNELFCLFFLFFYFFVSKHKFSVKSSKVRRTCSKGIKSLCVLSTRCMTPC